jgi:hypothetical protein
MLKRLVFVVGLAFLAGCGRDIIGDSAELDRALVPAIDFTTGREIEPARAAMDELVAAWEAFRARHHGYRADDPEWSAALAEIDTLVADVAGMVEDGEDLAFAAENLVDMRMMLAELRQAAGVEYIPDYLGELWEPVEDLFTLAMYQDSSTLTPADAAAMAVFAEEFGVILEDVFEAGFDARRYGFDAARVEEFDRRLEALADAGEELEAALAGTDRDRQLRAARALRPGFFELYRLFGDYDFLAAPGER